MKDKARIIVCMGTSGIAAGAEQVAAGLERRITQHGLGDSYRVVRAGDRGLFRDVLVDVVEPEGERVTYQRIKPGCEDRIVSEHLAGGSPVESWLAGKDYREFFENQRRLVLARCGETDPERIEDYLATGGYRALASALQQKPEDVLDEVESSGLRGRGGAGFPTGRKWRFTRQAPGDRKYVVCNADEGDPGAFMDRSLLEGDPHALIEGMALAGYATGATGGVVYCRAEYPLAVRRLQLAIEQAREHGWLGEDINGSGTAFDLRIMQGAGAFVCGEETALLASIEGRRGMPRNKPPFPAQKGLWDCPTTINNVETLVNVPHVVGKGAKSFRSLGTESSPGTKVFALAGKVRNTGLVEVPMGTPIRELVFGAGGGMAQRRIGFKGVQLGGPSGGCLPESLLDTPIDYESITGTGAIMGSGGVIIMDRKTCMVDVARYFINFTVDESCGQCTPCRVGLKRMLEVLEIITAGRGRQEHIEFLERMGATIAKTSLCGLGQTAPNPVLTTLRYFGDEYRAHVENRECPAHVCSELLQFEVMESECTACGICYRVCPVDAIEWEKGSKARINRDKCTECKSCINACPFMAVH